MVPFSPFVPLLPAAKNSGTRLLKRSEASLLLIEHSS